MVSIEKNKIMYVIVLVFLAITAYQYYMVHNLQVIVENNKCLHSSMARDSISYPNLYSLLVNPDFYDGKEVVVEGYYENYSNEEGSRTFLLVDKPSEDTLEQYGKTIDLEVLAEWESFLKGYTSQRVKLKGYFHKYPDNHPYLYATRGYIKVTKILAVDRLIVRKVSDPYSKTRSSIEGKILKKAGIDEKSQSLNDTDGVSEIMHKLLSGDK